LFDEDVDEWSAAIDDTGSEDGGGRTSRDDGTGGGEGRPDRVGEVKDRRRCVGGDLRNPIRCSPSWHPTTAKEWQR